MWWRTDPPVVWRCLKNVMKYLPQARLPHQHWAGSQMLSAYTSLILSLSTISCLYGVGASLFHGGCTKKLSLLSWGMLVLQFIAAPAHDLLAPWKGQMHIALLCVTGCRPSQLLATNLSWFVCSSLCSINFGRQNSHTQFSKYGDF